MNRSPQPALILSTVDKAARCTRQAECAGHRRRRNGVASLPRVGCEGCYISLQLLHPCLPQTLMTLFAARVRITIFWTLLHVLAFFILACKRNTRRCFLVTLFRSTRGRSAFRFMQDGSRPLAYQATNHPAAVRPQASKPLLADKYLCADKRPASCRPENRAVHPGEIHHRNQTKGSAPAGKRLTSE